MKLRYILIACVFSFIGWFARGYLQVPTDIEEELAANESICSDDTPPGYASYPVTKNGEIRGCLRVRVGAPDWTLPRQMFVRKGMPQ